MSSRRPEVQSRGDCTTLGTAIVYGLISIKRRASADWMYSTLVVKIPWESSCVVIYSVPTRTFQIAYSIPKFYT